MPCVVDSQRDHAVVAESLGQRGPRSQFGFEMRHSVGCGAHHDASSVVLAHNHPSGIADLRAKAATETDEASGTRSAQALLDHTTESMTSEYIRHKVGKKVRLLK